MHKVSAFLAGALLMASACAAIAQSTTPEPASSSGKLSLLDMAPPVYYGIKRFPKFYGDPNMDRATIDGSILDRQYLFGSFWGARDTLAKHGLVIDAGVTQVVQGVAAGDGDGAKYFGSGDLWVALDTGRVGLWPGGLIYAHLEGDWSETVSGSGALLPLNADTIMPAAPTEVALSELLIFQGLPAGFALVAGKVNWSAFADKSLFANDERNQFLYEGLNNNVLLGSFIPYTSLGGGIFKQISAELSAGIVITSNNTNALSAGFDDLSADTMTYGLAMSWTPTFGGLPGLYNVLVGYTSKSTISFDVDERYLLGEITGQVPVAQKNDNYALALGISQYLWVNKHARRSDGQPVGFGPFFRFGIAPRDRNLLDQFYSVGIGGNGGPFGRVNDNWGLGWAGTHFSKDFRRDAATLGVNVDSFEHAVEGYYNIALTPAVRLSLHAQYINSAAPSRDDALVLATRLQVDL